MPHEKRKKKLVCVYSSKLIPTPAAPLADSCTVEKQSIALSVGWI